MDNDVTLNDIIEEKQLKGLETRKDGRQNGIPIHLMRGMTERQVALYVLISPDGLGLTKKKAAERLGISKQAFHKRYKIMKRDFEEAFMYENVEELIVGDTNEIKNIYNGYVRFAKSKDIDWNLSLEELEETIRNSCNVCGEEPIREAYNFELGRRFKVNHLGRVDISKPYQYDNCYPICGKCIREGGIKYGHGYPSHIYRDKD